MNQQNSYVAILYVSVYHGAMLLPFTLQIENSMLCEPLKFLGVNELPDFQMLCMRIIKSSNDIIQANC